MSNSLNLIEIFGSVQGETSYTGLPTVFIRLAACNLRCSWCDTTYSFGRGEKWEMEQILDKTRSFGLPFVCVTGGEPLLQNNVHSLMTKLCNENFKVSLETGGSLSIIEVDPRVKVILDIKCPGSAMESKNDWSNLPLLKASDEVKFVIKDRKDYDYAKNVCFEHALFKKEGEVLFSPVHGELDPKELVSWILADQLPVRLNLQIHKFIWDPLTKGV